MSSNGKIFLIPTYYLYGIPYKKTVRDWSDRFFPPLKTIVKSRCLWVPSTLCFGWFNTPNKHKRALASSILPSFEPHFFLLLLAPKRVTLILVCKALLWCLLQYCLTILKCGQKSGNLMILFVTQTWYVPYVFVRK